MKRETLEILCQDICSLHSTVRDIVSIVAKLSSRNARQCDIVTARRIERMPEGPDRTGRMADLWDYRLPV